MAPRRNRPSSKQDILHSFAHLVAEQGYSETSIGQVADSLGLSKGTVVHHFGSKAALLESVHRSYMERRLAEAHHVVSTLATPPEQLAGMVYALLAAHRDDREPTLAFLREFVRFAADGELQGVRAQRESYTGLVETIIRVGMDRGHFRRDDPSLVTLQIFGMCNYAWTWYDPAGPKTCEEIAATFIRTILIGLLDGDTSGEREREVGRLAEAGIQAVRDAPGRVPTRSISGRRSAVRGAP